VTAAGAKSGCLGGVERARWTVLLWWEAGARWEGTGPVRRQARCFLSNAASLIRACSNNNHGTRTPVPSPRASGYCLLLSWRSDDRLTLSFNQSPGKTCATLSKHKQRPSSHHSRRSRFEGMLIVQKEGRASSDLFLGGIPACHPALLAMRSLLLVPIVHTLTKRQLLVHRVDERAVCGS
jgi:hypothetical protein